MTLLLVWARPSCTVSWSTIKWFLTHCKNSILSYTVTSPILRNQVGWHFWFRSIVWSCLCTGNLSWILQKQQYQSVSWLSASIFPSNCRSGQRHCLCVNNSFFCQLWHPWSEALFQDAECNTWNSTFLFLQKIKLECCRIRPSFMKQRNDCLSASSCRSFLSGSKN